MIIEFKVSGIPMADGIFSVSFTYGTTAPWIVRDEHGEMVTRNNEPSLYRAVVSMAQCQHKQVSRDIAAQLAYAAGEA